jgi:hypothetical protein
MLAAGDIAHSGFHAGNLRGDRFERPGVDVADEHHRAVHDEGTSNLSTDP